MLVRQSINSFIRTTEHYGYICNQLTRHDRVYNDTGVIFLKEISRVPTPISLILERIQEHFPFTEKEIIEKDLDEFLLSLAQDKFIVIGYSEGELDAKDTQFSYSLDNPKTLETDFTQYTKEFINENTQDFFLEEVQGRPLISSLQLELTSKCNERCIHCYIPNSKKNHGTDMPLEKFVKLIDEFVEMGGIHITLSGGESFMHKDIIPMLKYCRSKDLKITVLSNLINLKDEDIKALKETNVSLVQVSLYSMDKEIHDYITTVKGSFEKTKNAIEKLVSADVPVQISCPLMKANKDGYRDVLKYAQSLKISAQTDYIMMAQADLDVSNLSNRLSIKETEKVISDIIEYDIDYFNEIKRKKPISQEIKFDKERYLKQPICGVGYDNCCVTSNGDVYPCAGWQGYVLGNAYKESLKFIWEESERIKDLRKITNASFPECCDCEARQYCSMCLVRNYNENNGNMFKINRHFCQVAFLNKRLVEDKYKSQIKEIEDLYDIKETQ